MKLSLSMETISVSPELNPKFKENFGLEQFCVIKPKIPNSLRIRIVKNLNKKVKYCHKKFTLTAN